MYEKFGYVTYRRVLEYYTGDTEDALGTYYLATCFFYYMHLKKIDMRKALPRDVKKLSIIPLTRAIRVDELEWW